ncbi:MAG: hypothetical protein QNK37_17715 [Acidobacteriota bacterium]|nr:hypothetical protein [Acidobacteriota bacterium]
MVRNREVVCFSPGEFEAEQHYYTRVLNAQLHPLVKGFFGLGNKRIAERYSHLRPQVSKEDILGVLSSKPNHLKWAGADLFCVTNDEGVRRVVVIELNSCPSGQKSAPLVHQDINEHGGYRTLLEKAFLPRLKRRGPTNGGLAVLFDKNHTEAAGYAGCLADLVDEPVYLVPCFADEPDPSWRFCDKGVLSIRTSAGEWLPVRAALRYVTQKPWTRIPPVTKTYIFNPVLACLAGGRNKLLAAKAYDFYNAEVFHTGLAIRTPETIWDVGLAEVPMWVNRMGGIAVVKNPYSNAGQGVYTITNPGELDAFMSEEHTYGRFIVQSLIGNSNWSSSSGNERLYHVGTVPDTKNRIFVADLRFMIGVGEEGFFPVAIYARRARKPLAHELTPDTSSWDMLGTNLSYKDDDGEWQSESARLMLMDNRDFNRLGIGLDDLIDGYLQAVQAAIAIDNMAQSLLTKKGTFKRRFFYSINPDQELVSEICR